MQVSASLLCLLLTAAAVGIQVLAQAALGSCPPPRSPESSDPSPTSSPGELSLRSQPSVIGLTPALAQGRSFGLGDVNHKEETQIVCCFALTSRKIPLHFLTDYQLTSEACSLKGVIFKTKKNRQICANPKQKWVQDAMKHLDHRFSP